MVTTSQRLLGCLTLLTVSWAIAHVWFLEAVVVGQAQREQLTPLERIWLSVDNFTLRQLPLIVTAYLVVQSALFLVWILRPPEARAESGYPVALRLLSEWLRWAFAILGIALAGSVLAVGGGLKLTVLFLSLIPLFGWAYIASFYRAIQVQSHREKAGHSRVKPSHLALAGMIPPLATPLWPLGLAVPTWVLLSARNRPSVVGGRPLSPSAGI